jgi:hypothetical protein
MLSDANRPFVLSVIMMSVVAPMTLSVTTFIIMTLRKMAACS